jgi:hypothetical protein
MMWKIIAGVVVFGAVAFAAMSFIPETREGRASIELQALPEKIVDVLRDGHLRKDAHSVLCDGF